MHDKYIHLKPVSNGASPASDGLWIWKGSQAKNLQKVKENIIIKSQ